MRYFYYDHALFRGEDPGPPLERCTDQGWQPAEGKLFPSQQEMLHIREVTAEEAEAFEARVAARVEAEQAENA